ANARAVVTLVRPTEFLGSHIEIERLAASAKALPLIYAENDLPPMGENHLEALPPPFQEITVEAAPITKDNRPYANRTVTRRVILRYQKAWTLHARLAQTYNGISDIQQYRGVFKLLESDQTFVKYKSSFQQISFVDVLNG